jgi:hypothetical protein
MRAETGYAALQVSLEPRLQGGDGRGIPVIDSRQRSEPEPCRTSLERL